MFGGRMLWGVSPKGDEPLRMMLSGVAHSPQTRQLFYFLETDAVGALCRYNIDEDEERRLFHREGFRASDLAHHPTEALLACALLFPNGTANLGLMTDEGRELREITEGDALDLAPSWIPGKSKELLFQTSGLGRNPQGYVVGFGPFAIAKLNTETGEMKIVLQNPEYDFLAPRQDAAGNLYYIRRPYEVMGRERPSFLKLIKDIILFPIRLLRAIFHFLNAFSMFFAKQPLTSAGGPQMPNTDAQRVLISGKWIDVQAAMKQARPGGSPALVPASWELIRRSPDGKESVLAKHVVSFDLTADGTVVYSNGLRTSHRREDGKESILGDGILMEHVIALAGR